VRKAPNAWGVDGADVAAGWETAVDLYRHKTPQDAALSDSQRSFQPSTPLPPWLEAQALRCVQREGEMLIIPPAWWHQTYHPGPTLALAGQYLNDANSRGVFEHMLSWCGAPAGAADALLARPEVGGATVRERAAAALRCALQARHGEEGADALLERLWRAAPPRRKKSRTPRSAVSKE